MRKRELSRRFLITCMGALVLTFGLLILCAWAGGPPEKPIDQDIAKGKWLVFVSPPQEFPINPEPALAISLFERSWKERQRALERQLRQLRGVGEISEVKGVPYALSIRTEPQSLALISGLPGVEEVVPDTKAARQRLKGLPLLQKQRSALSRIIPLQAPLTLTVAVHLTEMKVVGETSLPTPVLITIASSTGYVSKFSTVIPIPIGSNRYIYVFNFCSGWIPRETILPPGGVITVSQAGKVITATIPSLSAFATAEDDSIYGTGPLSATVDVYLYKEDEASFFASYTTTVTASGAYTLMPGIDLVGGHYGYAGVTGENGVRFYESFVVPYVSLWYGGDVLSGKAVPYSYINVRVKDKRGQIGSGWGDAYSDPYGAFACYISQNYYGGWSFAEGDLITVSGGGQEFSTVVPLLTSEFHRDEAKVDGYAPPSSPLEISLLKLDGSTAAFTTTSSADGYYALSLAPVSPQATEMGFVRYRTPEGHRIHRAFAVPGIIAELNDFYLRGYLSQAAAPFTLTLTGASGRVKSMFFDTSSYQADFAFYQRYYYYENVKIYPIIKEGDRVSIEVSGEEEISLTVPHLTINVDPSVKIAYGEAPPSSHLEVWWGDYVREVTATATGIYTADFSSEIGEELAYGSMSTWYFDEQGNSVYIEAFAPYLSIAIGRKYVYTPYCSKFSCPMAVLLLDENGQLKERAQAHCCGVANFSNPIQAGDILVLEIEGQRVLTATVPFISARFDEENDLIYGQGPPSSTLSIYVYVYEPTYESVYKASQEWPYYYYTYIYTVETSAGGFYTLPLSGTLDIIPGSRGYVIYTSPHNYMVGYPFGAPMVYVNIGEEGVAMLLESFAPVSVTLLGPDGTEKSPPRSVTPSYLEAYASFDKPVEPGDTIVLTTASRVISVPIPLLTVSLDGDENLIKGMAPPEASLDVLLCRLQMGQEWRCFLRSATVSSSGGYSLTLPSDVTRADVMYWTLRGDQIKVTGIKPHLEVKLGARTIYGSSFRLGEPVTVTLYASDGSVKGQETGKSSAYHSSFSVYLDGITPTVGISDVIELRTPSGVYTFVIPHLTAYGDAVEDVVHGQAPPLTLVRVEVSEKSWLRGPHAQGGYYYSPPYRIVQADANGFYAADWSDVGLPMDGEGEVKWSNKRGDLVEVGFTVKGADFYLPLVLKQWPYEREMVISSTAASLPSKK